MPAHPTTERGREVRRRLLAAAVELVPSVGWEAVSTRMLADHAGVAPGLVHYHYTSVDALLREAAVEMVGELTAELRSTLADDPDVRTGITRMLAFLDPYTGSDPASLLFLETFLASTRDPALHRAMTGQLRTFVETMARWLDTVGVEDPEHVAVVLAASIDGLMIQRSLNPELSADAVRPAIERILGVHD